MLRTLQRYVFGDAKDPLAADIFHKLSLVAVLAWVGLGADGLSSSAYGPEEAFRALGGQHHLALYLALATAFTVFIISISYIQIIELFPDDVDSHNRLGKALMELDQNARTFATVHEACSHP